MPTSAAEPMASPQILHFNKIQSLKLTILAWCIDDALSSAGKSSRQSICNVGLPNMFTWDITRTMYDTRGKNLNTIFTWDSTLTMYSVGTALEQHSSIGFRAYYMHLGLVPVN
jgi:hypothetical protein